MHRSVVLQSSAPFESVLVANRGEIACRIIRTLRRLGIRSIAVYSDADRGARHVSEADSAIRIGPAEAKASYLNIEAIVAAARASGAVAVHPGYGFLSENPAFARACVQAGLVFIGPGEDALRLMGDKIQAKEHVARHGVPVIDGVADAGLDERQLAEAAARIGYPILVKPSAGGGGKGMQVVAGAAELPEALTAARRIAAAAFGDPALLLERLIRAPRHIEVQLLADSHGSVIHLGERECSLQRRHQKVIEEAPSPLLDPTTREAIGQAACLVARSVGYLGAGTVEFLVSADAPDRFFFIEMNTRLQVEHPVTELVTGLDLVEWQLRIAAGEPLGLHQDQVELNGHAVEARVYAEEPERGFLPSTGTVLALSEPDGPGIRVDSSLRVGTEVTSYYDPMLAKIVAWGPTRHQALDRLSTALAGTVVLGVRTNLEYLRALIADPDVRAGDFDTSLIERRLPHLQFHELDADVLAVAALYLHVFPEPLGTATPAGLWHGRSGWRQGGLRRPTRYRFAISAAERTDVLVTGPAGQVSVTVTVGSISREASIRADGDRFLVDLGGETGSWSIARDGRRIWVGSDGVSWSLGILGREQELSEELLARERPAGRSSPELRAPMPGTVIAVSVASGDVVEAGRLLITIEAMKMEHRLSAPFGGTVRLNTTVGDVVAVDQVLASIAETEPPDERPQGPAEESRRQ
ncbi:MAG: acetyl/propionyl/methylcrotonyl-CoA carboxylase subunit alpha [Microbacteriaceae bacterium]